MDNKFKVEHAHKLDNPERLEWQNPSKLFPILDAASPESFVEIGVGTGFWALPIAEHYPKCRVTGLDICDEMLAIFKKNAAARKLSNVAAALCDESKTSMPACSADAVLVANVYHELAEPEKMLAEIHRILRPGGALIVVDWKSEETPKGPPLEERVAAFIVKKAMEKTGFSNTETLCNVYPYQHTITGKK